jgi:hypothetical protein
MEVISCRWYEKMLKRDDRDSSVKEWIGMTELIYKESCVTAQEFPHLLL